jgi:hypothetical protein
LLVWGAGPGRLVESVVICAAVFSVFILSMVSKKPIFHPVFPQKMPFGVTQGGVSVTQNALLSHTS